MLLGSGIDFAERGQRRLGQESGSWRSGVPEERRFFRPEGRWRASRSTAALCYSAFFFAALCGFCGSAIPQRAAKSRREPQRTAESRRKPQRAAESCKECVCVGGVRPERQNLTRTGLLDVAEPPLQARATGEARSSGGIGLL